MEQGTSRMSYLLPPIPLMAQNKERRFCTTEKKMRRDSTGLFSQPRVPTWLVTLVPSLHLPLALWGRTCCSTQGLTSAQVLSSKDHVLGILFLPSWETSSPQGPQCRDFRGQIQQAIPPISTAHNTLWNIITSILWMKILLESTQKQMSNTQL